MAESRRKSLAKALTWRVVATSITASVGYAVVGDVTAAAAIGGADAAIKLVAYYLHERAWARVEEPA